MWPCYARLNGKAPAFLSAVPVPCILMALAQVLTFVLCVADFLAQ